MTAHGTVRNGKVVLDVPNALPDGTEVEVRPVKKRKPAAKKGKAVDKPLSLADRLKNVIGKATSLPSDAAANHDHYLYGAPKQQ